MRNLLILLLLCTSLTINATTYYIDPTGNNANNGSSASPWKTLAYACTKATASGDIIHVNAGTYIETSQSLLSVGVSIEGVGVASLIKSDVNSLATILLNSTTEGTNGNQHISGIKMDGDGLKGYIPVMVIRRSNVSIHDCTFIDFSHDGVSFYGDSWGSDSEPATYAANNSIYNNIITNCAGYSSGCCGYGDLRIDGQQDILIHDNVITQTARAAGSNGCGIKPDFTKGMKIYNNTITTDQRVGYESANSYNFSIELWNGHGTEIYNNNLYGTIDLGGHYEDKGAYEYGVSIHNNFIGSTYPTSVYLMAIDLEPDVSCDEIRIYSNQIKNVNQGINFLPTASAKYSNVKVYYNVFDQIGHNESSWGSSPAYAFSAGGGTASSITNFFFYNNVFNMSTYSGSLQANAIEIPCKSGVAVSYFYIQNNIMVGCDAPAIETKTSGTVDHLWITNNIFYGNANSNDPLMHVTPTNYTNANNIKASPAFVSASDFHLQAGSPAIGKGLTVTGMMTADCGGNALNNPPSIGAYESGSAPPPVVPVYQSATIQNATPSQLEMNYDLSLSNSIIPAVSAFSVLVNSATRAVNSISVAGTKLQLTLATAVAYGDIVKVSYTKPASNALQTTSGGQAISIVSQSVANNVSAAAPVYISSSIESSNPSLLEMNYNLSLANVVPDAASFTILINSVPRALSSVAVSGPKIQLTLTSPVVYGDVITVSYTMPASNPIQTVAGGKAISIGSQSVTNKVSVVSPAYISSSIENATPTVLEMTYNLSLSNVIPSASAFTVLVNSVSRAINTIIVSNTKVQLILPIPIVYSDIVVVSYTKPLSNPLQTTSGGQASTIVSQQVNNKVAGINPVYLSSTIENINPSVLEINYNQNLAIIIPSASSYTVQVNSAFKTVNSVAVSGTKVQLTLSSRINPGDNVQVTYIKPVTNPIQSTSGMAGISYSNQPVTNKCINAAPVAVITSPVVNTTFNAQSNINIAASASDPDGSVSMVEYFNNGVKIGSSSSAPYSYSWNNVAAGNYVLTVVATDNLNARTTSSSVPISVKGPFHNRHPFIKIFNPVKGNVYGQLSTITIDAAASDSDGIVSKVEFFNGSRKLVELTKAPYSYTWKDVPAGDYLITAIATDNMNDTTASAPIEFQVGIPVKYDSNSEIVNLYPNPNNGQFSIEFLNPIQNEKSEVIISDLSGKQVYSSLLSGEDVLKHFDLSDIQAGMYIMMIRDKGILVTKKFIKN